MNGGQALEQRNFDVRRVQVSQRLKHAIRLRFDRSSNGRRSVTEQDRSKASGEIDISIAIDIEEIGAFAGREKHRLHVHAARLLTSFATMTKRRTLDALETIERTTRSRSRRSDANFGKVGSGRFFRRLRELAERHAFVGSTVTR